MAADVPNVDALSGVPPADAEIGDAYLARSAAAGDAAAFAALYDRHYPAVYRYAYLRTPDRMAAEDVTSETFLRAMGSLHRYEPRAPFVSWLVRIARNVILDQARSSKRREARERLASSPGVADPEGEVMLRGEARELRAAVDRLSALQRDVLILRFYAGLSTEEISAALGKGASTVRGIQHRALLAMRRALEGRP